METNFVVTVLLIQQKALALLYAGPDQLLPLASVLGTIIGILLIGWQRITGFMRSAFNTLKERRRPPVNKQSQRGGR